MPLPNALTGFPISSSYHRVVQFRGGSIYDGTGSIITTYRINDIMFGSGETTQSFLGFSSSVAGELFSLGSQIPVITSQSHAQNTDIGTDSATFYIGGTDPTGSVHIHVSQSILSLRNSNDSDYRDLAIRNLYVYGTETIFNTETVEIGDNILELNTNFTGSVPIFNSGLHVNRGTVETMASLIWDEGTDRWKAGLEGSEQTIVLSPEFSALSSSYLSLSSSYVTLSNSSVTLGSFNAFTASYVVASSSFDSRIADRVTMSSFHSYTASVNSTFATYLTTASFLVESASFHSRIDLKANDNAVVKNTGNQNVAGVKNFLSFPLHPIAMPTNPSESVHKHYVDTELQDKLDISTFETFTSSFSFDTSSLLPRSEFESYTSSVSFDTSSLVTINTDQTITGIKTIANYLAFTNSATVDIGVPTTFPSVYDYNGENGFAISSRLNNESNYFSQTLLQNDSNVQKMFIGIVSGSSYSSTTPLSYLYFSNSFASIYANEGISLNADWIGLYSTSSIEIQPQGGVYLFTPSVVDVYTEDYISLFSEDNINLYSLNTVTIDSTLNTNVTAQGYITLSSGDTITTYAPNDIVVVTDALFQLVSADISTYSSGYVDVVTDGGLTFIVGSGSITPLSSDFVFKSSTPRFLFSGSNPYSNVYIAPESDNAYVVKKYVTDNFTSASVFLAFSQSVSSSLANISFDTSSLVTWTAFNSYTASVTIALGDKLDVGAFESYTSSVSFDTSSLVTLTSFETYTASVTSALSGKVDTSTFTSLSSSYLSLSNSYSPLSSSYSALSSSYQNLSYFPSVANSAGTVQIVSTGSATALRFAGAGASSVSFDNTTKTITISSTDTNTTYTAGTGLTLSSTQFALTGQALALHNLASNGIIARTGASAYSARTITAGTGVSVSNGNGGSGNPTISIGQAVGTSDSPQFANLGVGTVAGTGGTIRATGDITAFYSDRRLKEHVGYIENALEKVMGLDGVVYRGNHLAKSFGYDTYSLQVGVYADQIEAVLPEAVTLAPCDSVFDETTGEFVSVSGMNLKTVKYEKIVPLLIEAIKDLKKEIDTLKIV